MSLNNIQKEIALESIVERILEGNRNGPTNLNGTVAEVHHLLRRHDYPDFYVRDTKNREYLIECKNLGITTLRQGGVWIERPHWVRKNIITKKWANKRYKTRNIIGYRHNHRAVYSRINIRTSPIPVLIITHFNFNAPAVALLQSLFNGNIIVFHHQIGKGGFGPLILFFSLRELII